MTHVGHLAPAGDLNLTAIRPNGHSHNDRLATVEPISTGSLSVTAHPDDPRWPSGPVGWKDIVFHGFPRIDLPEHIRLWRRSNLKNLWRGLRRIAAAKALGIPTFYGAVYLTVFRGDGRIDDYGLASLRVVTTAGVGYIVDGFQNLAELENMKYHGIGTGSTAEAVGDTALVTELTTEYNPNSTRATGTTTESAANIYRTVGTNTLDSGNPALREHGVLSQAATGGGVLLDRSVFAAITLDGTAGDGLQSTYDLTLTAGS